MLLCVFVTLAVWNSATALLESVPFPDTLEECYKSSAHNLTVSQNLGLQIQTSCYRKHLYSMYSKSSRPNITQPGINYINSLFRQIFNEIDEERMREKSNRHKRQAFRTWRYRQEVRVPGAFDGYSRCINRLNMESVEPGTDRNTYQTLAVLHSGQTLSSAHQGPAFLPWHAIYLLVIETACRAPIPYWDSSMDNDMTDPTTSILWTERYFGNGDGDVTTGPFSSMRTILNTPLIRNIGTGQSALMTKRAYELVLSRSRLGEISEGTQTDRQYVLEAHHNGPHNWVDGYLARPPTAAYDPIFFCHHSAVQGIWELFRTQQWSRGIDPGRDYPFGGNLNIPNGHNWNDIIDFQPFIQRMRNYDAISNYFSRLVRYQAFPSCQNRCNGSPHLSCIQNVCVSSAGAPARLMTPAMAAGAAPGLAGAFALRSSVSMDSARTRGAIPAGGKFPDSPFTDSRNRMDELPSAPAAPSVMMAGEQVRQRARAGLVRAKRSTLQKTENATFVSPPENPSLSSLDRRYKNTFMIDGVIDTKRWVYVSVRVIYERSVNEIGDMHNPANYQKLSKLQSFNIDTNKCSTSGSGASKVFIATDGLDYEGSYKEYTIIDERQPVSTSTVFVGIKNPEYGEGTVLFSAYDYCGRSCRPACLSNYGAYPSKYKPCSGAFKVTQANPKMFSLSYGDAIAMVWNVDNILNQDLSVQAPITFICDYKYSWPWQYKL